MESKVLVNVKSESPNYVGVQMGKEEENEKNVITYQKVQEL
jgi:hypothetical protein